MSTDHKYTMIFSGEKCSTVERNAKGARDQNLAPTPGKWNADADADSNVQRRTRKRRGGSSGEEAL